MNLVILGGGESGVGAAILGKQEGWTVFVSDFGKIKEKFKRELEQYEIEYEEGKHSFERIEQANLAIKSPGIPDKVPVIKRLIALDIEIIDEIEFGFRYAKDATIIAITGSNGKTTTAGLIHHILKTAGLNVGIGGNIGFSFAKQIALDRFDYYVLELSSFQLDYCKTFRPDISILINITPDHLDRYDYKMENYIASKISITKNQTETDTFIFNKNDENIQQAIFNKNVQQIPIEVNYNDNSDLKVKRSYFDTDKITLKGPHNHFNASCAITTAKLLGINNRKIRKGLSTFINAPHRLEFITTIKGVDYINDSKATNIDSAFQALKAMTKPVIWIAGGQDKGNNYNILTPLIQEKVKAMICLCKDSSKLLAAFQDIIPTIQETQNVNEVITLADQLATEGDVVLLSPACASFDLFPNYITRGDLFREAIRNYELRIKNLSTDR